LGGVYLAAGNVTGDGLAEIITGAGQSGGPHVRVFSGVDLSQLFSMLVYAPNFTGGVFVAGGDLNADGKPDVFGAYARVLQRGGDTWITRVRCGRLRGHNRNGHAAQLRQPFDGLSIERGRRLFDRDNTFHEVRTIEDLRAASDALGFPLRLKASLGGYDGRSQVRIGAAGSVATRSSSPTSTSRAATSTPRTPSGRRSAAGTT
jgi:hypothetical protein